MKKLVLLMGFLMSSAMPAEAKFPTALGEYHAYHRTYMVVTALVVLTHLPQAAIGYLADKTDKFLAKRAVREALDQVE